MTLPRLTMAITLLALLLFSLAPHTALAAPLQEAVAGGDDRTAVIIWTLVSVGVMTLVLAIGYVYRRAAGVDKAPPVALLEPGESIRGD